MVVFVHLEQIGAAVAYFIALGLFVPTHPDFETIQKFIRVMATDVEYLHVKRTYMALRPIYDKSGPAGPCGSRHDHHHHEDHY
jgi:hypothetical protein